MQSGADCPGFDAPAVSGLNPATPLTGTGRSCLDPSASVVSILSSFCFVVLRVLQVLRIYLPCGLSLDPFGFVMLYIRGN